MTTESSLTRLRRANPVAQAPTLDAPEMFAQITSLPGDPRLTRPASHPPARHRRRGALLVLVLAATALLASTAYAISNWVGATYRGVDPKPVDAETCLYTNTEDEGFIFDPRGRVLVCSACSGHGFKFAPAIGKRLAGLARA